MSDEIPFLFKDNKPNWWGDKFHLPRASIIPDITPEVKERFLKQVILTHDDIQESVADDIFLQHDAIFKWQIRAYIEWERSPCIEHNPEITHEQCLICRRIAVESVKRKQT